MQTLKSRCIEFFDGLRLKHAQLFCDMFLRCACVDTSFVGEAMGKARPQKQSALSPTASICRSIYLHGTPPRQSPHLFLCLLIRHDLSTDGWQSPLLISIPKFSKFRPWLFRISKISNSSKNFQNFPSLPFRNLQKFQNFPNSKISKILPLMFRTDSAK